MKKVNWKCEYRKTRAITLWSGGGLEITAEGVPGQVAKLYFLTWVVIPGCLPYRYYI